MPALNIDIKDLKDRSFIKSLSGKNYLTVAGRLYLAHSSGQLVGIETFEMYPDDPDLITIQAMVKLYNPVVIAEIEKIAANETMAIELKQTLVKRLADGALISTFTGMAASKRRGGKSAEGTNPREVAETSAVGRALGNAGFGDTESFASFEEMMVALSRDGSPEPEPKPAKKSKKPADPNAPTAEQKEQLYDLAVERLGVADKSDFAAKIEAQAAAEGKKLAEFTKDDVDRLIAELQKIAPF